MGMNNPLDTILFDDKSSSDVFKEIYNNSKKKDKQINSLIAELKPLIQNIGDAPVVVPLIKEYLEVSVKNDDQLAKLLAVVQRLIGNNAQGDNDFGISEEEKKQLLDELNAIEEGNKKIEDKVKGIDNGRLHKGKE